jgi:hypothetical protein
MDNAGQQRRATKKSNKEEQQRRATKKSNKEEPLR